MYDIIDLNNKLVGELKEIAKNLNVPKYEALKKQELIYKILDQQAITPPPANDTPVNNKPEENRILRPRKPRPEQTNQEHKPKLEATPLFSEEEIPVLPKTSEPIQEIKDEQPKPEEKPKEQPVQQVAQPQAHEEKREQNHNKSTHNNPPKQQDLYNFDGIVSSEGVLEIMPDGYGFLHSKF